MAVEHPGQIEEARPERAGDYQAVKPQFGPDAVRKRLAWCAEHDGTWYVWREGDQYVGWAVVSWPGKAPQPGFPDVHDVYVREDYRGRGIGTAILRAIEQEAAWRGHDRIGLAVNPEHNPRALALYRRLGYVEVGTPPYIDGVYDGYEDWVIDMTKEIRPDASLRT